MKTFIAIAAVTCALVLMMTRAIGLGFIVLIVGAFLVNLVDSSE